MQVLKETRPLSPFAHWYSQNHNWYKTQKKRRSTFFKFGEPKPQMRKFTLYTLLFSCSALAADAQGNDAFFTHAASPVNNMSSEAIAASPTVWSRSGEMQTAFLSATEPLKKTLLYTAKAQPVELWYFPGTSRKNALVIGGLHGSELSAVEVARQLIGQLANGEKPYYNVLVLPALFPDNADVARNSTKDRVLTNTGRYTSEAAADPNRQMPLAGKPFLSLQPVDAMEREIENEMKALLQLIQTVKPDRLLSIHAIREPKRAGVFADPRTDCNGTALGFETDEDLALLMAEHIQAFGGACPGNNLDAAPTALYYLDPAIAPAGQTQLRSYQLASLQGKSRGVSLGTWSSTAVCDEDPSLVRSAIRTFTMEFPGYLVPAEYKTVQEQQLYQRMVNVYAASIQRYFLQSFFEEAPTQTALPQFATR